VFTQKHVAKVAKLCIMVIVPVSDGMIAFLRKSDIKIQKKRAETLLRNFVSVVLLPVKFVLKTYNPLMCFNID